MYEIVNKQVKILTSQCIGTCKGAYTKGYALNWVLTEIFHKQDKYTQHTRTCKVPIQRLYLNLSLNEIYNELQLDNQYGK